ncbi:hypothetical protein SAMD00019534_025250 [Acytostelium subglobosum LB1]|uniref:hypothetical protein n=1 Tax=Acytostelium subglobosum LB1 TaxID=1410327 RepID=UPI000644E39B|nr:hypothetical protein SAMD00019534_025250 [Acytostelium subglobosum LB1]GAM19350.1 hypothetical protein SAMD00019534_025250 [Acytostelium subglobosum LB1]|eukprot:XP_012757277.1 hypothetical protein SAMD00019534_025250 [Acytostelium subglobosum LB1]
MFHDFIGNTAANGFSTIDSIFAKDETSCDVNTDSSSYWFPSLKIKGYLIRPSYAKIYYQANNSAEFPVTNMPKGLQLIAGSPKSNSTTGPSRGVSYACSSSTWSRVPLKTCLHSVNQTFSQMNINLVFPNCWDGFTIRPNFTYKNAVYEDPDVEGKCPPEYPHRIARLNMHIAYYFNETDLSDAQLSLNPTMDANGTWSYPWADLFSAHGDFFNGWHEESMKFMTDECLNGNVLCGNDLPRVYGPVDTTYTSTLGAKKVTGDILKVTNSSAMFIKLTIPERSKTTSWSFVGLQVYSQNNNENASATFVNSYTTTADVFNSDNPTCLYKSRSGAIYLDGKPGYRSINITQLVVNATAAGQKELYLCLRGPDGVNEYSIQSTTSNLAPRLMFMDPGRDVKEAPLPGNVPILYVPPSQPPPPLTTTTTTTTGPSSGTQLTPSIIILAMLLLLVQIMF